MYNHPRGYGNGAGPRGGPHRSSSGGYYRQSAAPYSRPTPSRGPSSSYDYRQEERPQRQPSPPPSQVSIRAIRGSSSIPTQVLISNLAPGTTSEDLRQAFLKCGDIIRVRERSAASSRGDGGLSFEVLFEDRQGALNAVRDYHNATADGNQLSVFIEEGRRTEPPQPKAQQQQQQAASNNGAVAPPTGPRGAAAKNGNGAAAVGKGAQRRELLEVAPNAKERKALAKAQAVVVPTGPKANAKSRAANVQTAKAAASAATLQSRLGGLPLAQRLGGVKGGNETGGARSDLATLEANKSKKAAKRQAQAAKAAAAGAAVTSATMTGGTAPTKNQIQKQKRKAKIAALKEQQKGSGTDSAMQLD